MRRQGQARGVPANAPLIGAETHQDGTSKGMVDPAWLAWMQDMAARQPVVGDLVVSFAPNRDGGWLLCDGAAAKRAEYPDLCKLMEAAGFAVSDTLFDLPDIPPDSIGARTWVRGR